MPYIQKEQREKFKTLIDEALKIENEGELNFVITCLLQQYILQQGESYKIHNALLGVLTAVQLEWYRRKVSHYENSKCNQNGDVF